MNITGSIVVFIVIWWVIFFMALPFGVRSQWEDDDVVGGTEAGAPVVTGLRKKALITTGVTVVLWAIVWMVVYLGLIDLGQNATWS